MLQLWKHSETGARASGGDVESVGINGSALRVRSLSVALNLKPVPWSEALGSGWGLLWRA